MNRICFFNQSSVHYRASIYELMDKELSCDFYFGNFRRDNIKEYDNKGLNHFKGTLKNIFIGPFYWQKGAISLLFKPYKLYLTPGDTYCLSTWCLLLFSTLFQKKVFLWTHGAYGNENWIKRQIIKFRSYLVDGFFLYGERAKQILLGYGIPEHKLHLIYNSLSYDEHVEIRKGLIKNDVYRGYFKNKNKNIIFIGRLTVVKKLHMLLSAVSMCKKRGREYNVTFIGNGPQKIFLERKAVELGIKENVWYFGECYDERVIGDMLYNADVCVSPGNVGLTAIHALSFGLPVITNDSFETQMPEFEAIEEGVTGSFFRDNDISDLAEKIELWLTYSDDRESVRSACYKVIDEKYNPHKQIEKLKTVLK